MLKEINFFNNKIKLIVEVLNNKLIVKDIININKNDYNIILINDKQLKIEQEIFLDIEYKFKLINLFSSENKKAIGIINSFSKKDLLTYINNEKFYDLKILLNDSKNYLIEKNKLYTSFFNEKPLFYKFKINIKDFDSNKLSIFSEDSKQEKFIFNDLKTEQYIYFSPEINKKYFYKYENKIDQIQYKYLIDKTNKILNLKKHNNINSFIKWIDIISEEKENIELEITFDDNNKELFYIDTINNLNHYKSNSSLYINKLVKEIKINNLKNNLKLNIFNEDYFILKDNHINLVKNKNTDYIFESKEIKIIDFNDIINLKVLSVNKKYIIENNKLVESEVGFLKLREIDSNDLIHFNFNLFVKNINNIKTDIYDFKIDEYYINNFKNNKQYFKGDINV